MSKASRDCKIEPPAAKRRPTRLSTHGKTRVDDYFWLRERDDRDVLAYLKAENAYADAVLEPWTALKSELVAEMKARIPPEDGSVPYRKGPYAYYYRYETGQEYPKYLRRLEAADAEEELLLDTNRLAESHDYFSLRGFTVSPDHERAVFAVDTEGRRFYTLHVLDIRSGELLDDRIDRVTSNVEWADGGTTLLYVRQHEDSLRDFQVWRHVLGRERDELVYQEDDTAYWLSVEKSLSGKSLFVTSAATTTTEVHVMPASRPDASLRVFLPRAGEHEYYVTDGGDRYFILSNDGATNFRVFEAPLTNAERSAWKEFVPHREDVLIEGFDVFEKHVVLSTVVEGLDRLEVVERATGQRHVIDIDEAVYTAYTHDNFVYDSGSLRFSYESLTTPESTYDYGLSTKVRHLLKRRPVGGGFDSAEYASERVTVRARDGTGVPVSLVCRGAERPLARPLLLEGYGAYGICYEPDFDSTVFSLLDRGFVYAIAHVRGGSELGREWCYAGRRQAKDNTFNDFIDVTRYLIDAGYTAAVRCYAAGGSAGGLLIAVVANRAPELFHGMIARVPFVDVLTTMLDASIPLTTGEYEEWGDPNDPEAYARMASYSPYDNVASRPYPHLLVTTGLHDSQVQYWEPAKWVAKLRALNASSNLILLKTDVSAGHSGKTGRYRSLEDTALEYGFLLALEDERESAIKGDRQGGGERR